MNVHTDDEVYSVDAVWLGPPKLTLPWRARYVAYVLGLAVLISVMALQRQLGIGFGVLSTAWALVVTVAIVRLAGRTISEERPLTHVITSWWIDVRTPRPPRDIRPRERRPRRPHRWNDVAMPEWNR